jgi:hypothetical protein
MIHVAHPEGRVRPPSPPQILHLLDVLDQGRLQYNQASHKPLPDGSTLLEKDKIGKNFAVTYKDTLTFHIRPANSRPGHLNRGKRTNFLHQYLE